MKWYGPSLIISLGLHYIFLPRPPLKNENEQVQINFQKGKQVRNIRINFRQSDTPTNLLKKKPLKKYQLKPSPTLDQGTQSSVKLIGEVIPEYPWQAQKNDQEGEVQVQVEIDKFGMVIKANILQSSGFSILDRSALAAAKKAKFQILNAKWVNSDLSKILTFQFKLKKKGP